MANNGIKIAFIIYIIFLPLARGETLNNQQNEFYFDPSLLQGLNLNSATLEKLLSNNSLLPGVYDVGVYINKHYLMQQPITFNAINDKSIQPCFTPEQLEKLNIKVPILTKAFENNGQCLSLNYISDQSYFDFDQANLQLHITLPMQTLKQSKNYVSLDKLDSGESVFFVNYLTNYYHVNWSDRNDNQDSAWLSLNTGVNLGMWQLRHLSNANWTDQQHFNWHSLRTYVQRPLPHFGSQLSIGELMTTGRFFSGLNYDGIHLATEDRMLHDAYRGYAPVVHGIATTPSNVIIYQDKRKIYQTSVPAGDFYIDDIYPLSYSYDLDVEVTDIDGHVTHFSVPFSAVPESMRPGVSHYEWTLGKTRDNPNERLFSDFTWQQGLTNRLTFNSGFRLAKNYQAYVLGGVYGSYLGALGTDITYSRAALPQSTMTGWMTKIAYSKAIQATHTTFALATYRYSDKGYRDLNEALSQSTSKAASHGNDPQYYQPKEKFEISINQRLDKWGDLFLSGSRQSYHSQQKTNKQLQWGYSNSLRNGISYTFSMSRHYYDALDKHTKEETISSININIPLHFNKTALPTAINSNWIHSSNNGNQYQVSSAGLFHDDYQTNYNLGIQYDDSNKQKSINGSLHRQLPLADISMSAAKGEHYWQASAMAQGAAVAHANGITLGPYLSETFALIEAKGATGVKVYNARQSTIDKNGYAIVPSVLPYHDSMIALSADGLADNIDLIENEKQITPVAGAAVKVKFHVKTGTALIMKITLPNGQDAPFASEVFDSANSSLGLIAQQGQFYLRTDKLRDTLFIKWGDTKNEVCHLTYQLSISELSQHFVKKDLRCDL